MTTFYIANGVLFFGTSFTDSVKISNPTFEQLVEMKVPEVQARGLISYLQRPAQVLPVPDEYKNKYCLLFRGQVCYSYDSKEEMERGKNIHCHLAFTEYHPQLT